MTTLHIQGGRIVDPAHGRDEIADLWAVDGRISHRAPSGPIDTVIDARGRVVAPGFIDMHVHLREPGREDKETIATGTRAAAAGGYTSVVPMPNTTPVIDSTTGVKFILERSKSEAVVNVFPTAAVTRGQQGKELTEFGDLVGAGVVAFTDDGMPVMNNEIMRRALEYSSMFGVPILDHCEDLDLAAEGVMHEGKVSLRLGLKGWPSVAESIQVARDVELAAFTGGQVHICHCSTAASVEAIRLGKRRGVKVSGEASPHHIALTDERVLGYHTNAKCKPPLASEADRMAVIEGLVDDTLEVIATDHAPHTVIEKDLVFNEAPFGLMGMETAFGVLNMTLIRPGILSLSRVIGKLTVGPARVLKLNKGTLGEGADADITILDPERVWTVDVENFFSRSRNCPWHGEPLTGRATETIVGGRLIYQEGKILV
jgi:dihydroorotase